MYLIVRNNVGVKQQTWKSHGCIGSDIEEAPMAAQPEITGSSKGFEKTNDSIW